MKEFRFELFALVGSDDCEATEASDPYGDECIRDSFGCDIGNRNNF